MSLNIKFWLAIFSVSVLSFTAANFTHGHDGHVQKVYYVNKFPHSTFWAASNICQSRGQRLASVTSAEDDKLLREAIEAAGVENRALWIGGTDEISEGRWQWVGSGRPITGYTNFRIDEPNNCGCDRFDLAENCLNVGDFPGTWWNDQLCSKKSGFICENISGESHYTERNLTD